MASSHRDRTPHSLSPFFRGRRQGTTIAAVLPATVAVDSLERVLWWLFRSSIGAATRARVLLAIRDEPRNAQQLAGALVLDYKTVRHHLRVLGKNGLVTTAGERYGQVYFLSPSMESHWTVFESIVKDMKTRGDRRAAK